MSFDFIKQKYTNEDNGNNILVQVSLQLLIIIDSFTVVTYSFQNPLINYNFFTS